MKKTKNLLAIVAMMLLVAMLSVVGTIAWLSAETNVVTNTFTAGNVSFDKTIGTGLDEALVNEYGKPIDDEDAQNVVDLADAPRVTGNDYKLVPGHTYTKDPTVHMSSSTEPAWLFVKVDNGIAAIEGTTNTIANQMKTIGWTEIVDEDGNGTNIWWYKDIVTKDQDIIVFNQFTLTGEFDVEAYEDATIDVQAYAVQADTFDTALAAWAAAPYWNN